MPNSAAGAGHRLASLALRRRAGILLSAALLALVAPSAPAPAADMPVFRYALERWAPDDYRALVIHRGELSTDHRRVEQRLRALAAREAAPANLQVHTLNLDHPSDPVLQLAWENAGRPTPPCLVLAYPLTRTPVAAAWWGPLNDASVAALTTSAARLDIARRLIAGDAIVWVVLDTGQPAADNAAFKKLNDALDDLQEAAAPADTQPRSASPSRAAGEEAMSDAQSAAGPAVPIRFSTLRIRRDDPAEAVLVSLLLRNAPDLARSSDPVVFPVFGRGRLHQPLAGAHINAANIGQAAAILTGPSPYSLEGQGRGIDLLIAVNWTPDHAPSEPESPDLTRLVAATAAAAATPSTAPAATAGHASPAHAPAPGHEASSHAATGHAAAPSHDSAPHASPSPSHSAHDDPHATANPHASSDAHAKPGAHDGKDVHAKAAHPSWAARGPMIVGAVGLGGGAAVIALWLFMRLTRRSP